MNILLHIYLFHDFSHVLKFKGKLNTIYVDIRKIVIVLVLVAVAVINWSSWKIYIYVN